MKQYLFVFLIGLVLFISPFFWMKPGDMDLGGDSNRLYFYDPVSFIQHTSLFNFVTQGKGGVEPNYYYIPYVGILAILKLLIPPWMLIAFINGLKLAGGFIAVFFIVHELLKTKDKIKNESMLGASLLSAIFYTVSFGSYHMAYFWGRAITSHNQIFVNPLMFYLILKFLRYKKYAYLWSALLLSFVFSPNFGLTSAPPFFAFFPLALIFLFLISWRVFNQLSWKQLVIGLMFFLGIHAFHLLPQILSLFDSGSFTNTRVFDEKSILHDIEYFTVVSGYAKTSLSLLVPSENSFMRIFSFVAPFIITAGLFASRGKNKLLIYTSIFFVATLFLATANITATGFELYKKLLYIPGFGMFRNFYTQWMYVFLFFYSLLVGLTAHSTLDRFKSADLVKRVVIWVAVLMSIPGIILITGYPVRSSVIRGSDNVKTSMVMDPRYEETLGVIRELPHDGKILILPITDAYYQVIAGRDGGVYEGPSTTTHLAGRHGFVGYQDFYPYPEDIMKYSRDKNYDRLLRILNTLNIRYILHNSDPKIYEEGLQPGPYQYMLTSMPKTQKEYTEFISKFPVKQIYENGPYIIYEVDSAFYNPTVFVPDAVYTSKELSYESERSYHSVFLDDSVCSRERFMNICSKEYKSPSVTTNVRLINPTEYAVTVQSDKPVDNLFVVMQHSFHPGWKLVLNKETLAEDFHVPVSGYANGWLLGEQFVSGRSSFSFNITLVTQSFFWYGLFITSVSLILVVVLLTKSIISRRERKSTEP